MDTADVIGIGLAELARSKGKSLDEVIAIVNFYSAEILNIGKATA